MLNRRTASTPAKPPIELTRRELLALLGLTATGAAVAPSLLSGSAEAGSARSPGETRVPTSRAARGGAAGRTAAGAVAGPQGRALVVIELQGGHDGFSMLVPSGNARFRQLRDRALLPPEMLSPYDDGYSLAKGLAPIAKYAAFIEGVGVAKPDLSHFAMLQRWWQGDPDGTGAARTGFLGRCCDAVPETAVAGVSVGGGATPALVSARASTVALPGLQSLRELTKDQDPGMRVALNAIAGGGADRAGLEVGDEGLLAAARAGMGSGLQLLGQLGAVDGSAAGYPKDNVLGASLSLVRELISLNAGMSVFHVPWGSFDTHTGHVYSHSEQMKVLGSALAAFRTDLANHGLSDRVLLATTSEFGRRPEANAGGTDHGTASTMLLMGPIRPGRHGSPVDFGALDRDGNPKATVSLSDYYATLATWLGLPAKQVLPTGGSPLDALRPKVA